MPHCARVPDIRSEVGPVVALGIRTPVPEEPGSAALVLDARPIRTRLTKRDIQEIARFLRFALYDLDPAMVYPREFYAQEQALKAAHMIRCARERLFSVSKPSPPASSSSSSVFIGEFR
jgi:hypothetical protein